jgi:hypothetical protein
MENWKRALIASSVGVSVFMFLKRKPSAGIIVAGVGLATLASEYPEKFSGLRERLPDYLEQGRAFVGVVSRVGERLAEVAENGSSRWYETLLRG